MEYSSKEKIARTTLVIAAHPDDEVLGCGASIAKWSAAGEHVHIIIMAEGLTSRQAIREVEGNSEELSQLALSATQAGEILGASSVKLFGFPDNRMDSLDLLDVIKEIEKVIDKLKPVTVVTHHAGDLNIDHRVVHKAVVTACRPQQENSAHRILTFETPSSSEWQPPGSNVNFQPNWFENVSNTLNRKLDALTCYQSEMRKWPHPRTLKGVEHLAKWRGATVGCDAAEAFMLLREIR